MICTLLFKTYPFSSTTNTKFWIFWHLSCFEFYFCRFDYEVSYHHSNNFSCPHELYWSNRYGFSVGRRGREQFQCITNVCGDIRIIECPHRAGKETLILQESINLPMKISFIAHCFVFFCQAKRISEAEEKYEQIMKSLDPHLSSNYRRRCEEATKEGNKITIPSKIFFPVDFIDLMKMFRWENFWSYAGNVEHTGGYLRRKSIPSCSALKRKL